MSVNNILNKQSQDSDLVVIGGGPGGYVAAIRAAQMGAKVVLIEKENIGGNCLNYGCIPTKILLKASGFALIPPKAREMGINLKLENINVDKVNEYKQKVVEYLRDSLLGLIDVRNIQFVNGYAILLDNHNIEVTTEQDKILLKAKKIIVATGSKPKNLDVNGGKCNYIMNSAQALELKEIPSKILIVGGGAIGIEFALIYHNLGAEVIVIESMPQILPQVDIEIVSMLEETLQNKGIKLYKNTEIIDLQKKQNGIEAIVMCEEKEIPISVQSVLSAIGREPVTDSVLSSGVDVDHKKGTILVNKYLETNLPNVYAVGDVIGGILQAHIASYEGVIAAENVLDSSKKTINYKVAPTCVYSTPEIACVGLTEYQAKEEGYEIRVGRFPLSFNGRAIADGVPLGLVKIVVDSRFNEILGVHIFGENATSMIAEAALAMRLESTAEEILDTMHPHPTVSESLMEAAGAVLGRAIHLP